MQIPEGFFSPLSPGWFLQWAVDNESLKHPTSSITVVSPSLGQLCGTVPGNWDGSHITLTADDRMCGLVKE